MTDHPSELETWTDYQDDISDAISDSMDMDWSASVGAQAVVSWLNEHRPLSAAPAPEGGAVKSMGQRAYENMRDNNDNASRAMNSNKSWAELSDEERRGWEEDANERPGLYALATREEAPAEAGEDVNWKAEYEAACAARISDRQKSQEVINERDKWVAELLQERAALRAQPPARSGKVTWHSSGEDEGPDVGMQLDLGHGRSLWLGEGQKPTGWQFSLVHGDDIIPVADVIDHDQARDLFDLIASAVQPPAREDAQPFMFAYEDVDKPGDWRAFRRQIRRTDGSICPGRALYTHPAPDALRVAVEALETTRNRINTWPIDDHETCMCGSTIEAHDIGSGHFPVSQADHAVSTIVAEINKALSALQAEQKGGA